MADRRPRCIFLAGAPDADELQWDERELLKDFTAGSTRSHRTDPEDGTLQPTPSWQPPKWRSIELNPRPAKRKRTEKQEQTSFLSYNDTDAVPALDIATKQDFLEHSFALLQDSQGPIPNEDCEDGSTFLSTTFTSLDESGSFNTSIEGSFASDQQQEVLPPNLPITDISQVPTAQRLLALAPQTVTINILCAVITASPPRTVSLRRFPGRTAQVLDLLVGDETRAGFSVSFWLGDGCKAKAGEGHGDDDVQALRSGDVVCLRNVALGVFRGQVFGRSLRGGWTRIVRLEDGVRSLGGATLLVKKAERVVRWAEGFVGRRVVGARRKGRRLAKGDEESLPPDTQD